MVDSEISIGKMATCPKGHKNRFLYRNMVNGGWSCPDCSIWYHNSDYTNPQEIWSQVFQNRDRKPSSQPPKGSVYCIDCEKYVKLEKPFNWVVFLAGILTYGIISIAYLFYYLAVKKPRCKECKGQELRTKPPKRLQD